MTKKRFVGNFHRGMLVSIKDTVDDKNVNILQIVEIANQVVIENEQLKQRVSELECLLELDKLHKEVEEGKRDKFVELKLND